MIENGKKLLKRDFSGKPREINKHLLELLLDGGYMPLLTIPLVDEDGFAVNSENDDVVAQLQLTMEADTVLQLIEAPGFMGDPTDPDSVMPTLASGDLPGLVEQSEGRIKRKLYALNKLAQNGASRIIICDGRTEHPVRDGLAGKGTVIE